LAELGGDVLTHGNIDYVRQVREHGSKQEGLRMAKRAARSDAAPATARPSRARAPRNGANGEQKTQLIPNEDDIRVRAYHLYLERGAVDGNDVDDWVAAERELKLAHN
jgi:hypothetical protein